MRRPGPAVRMGRRIMAGGTRGIPRSASRRRRPLNTLSARTGKRYRLPTDAEWTRAATAGFDGPLLSRIDSVAWHEGNSGSRSHPVAAKRADRLGLYDMLGNAAEWVLGADGRPLTRGGSWADPPSTLNPATSARYSSSWQERDPQFPKSRWWLSDGPFVGFRIVREP
jgi:formylglycine-generating enzyme required for sulfatase activity